MAHVFQVGVGSGGMPVLDMIARDERITRVTLVEPDVYKPHNVVRHVFPAAWVGEPKAELAARWLEERRPGLTIRLVVDDLRSPSRQAELDRLAAECDLGVCAADNEVAKFHFDTLMRRHGKPWTLGEVLSGGIGGFVHRFVPGGPCYGCVASHLQRAVVTDASAPPDYSNPGAAVAETTIPAGIAAIHAIAALHAQWTVELLDPPMEPAECRTLLWTLRRVPGVFDEAYRPYRFRVPRLEACLVCGPRSAPVSAEDLDVALDQALARLGGT